MSKKFFITNSSENPLYSLLNSLSIEEISKTYSETLNKNVIHRTSYYNQVANILGFKSWADYKNNYKNNLELFMKQNNLINHNTEIFNKYYPFKLSYRDISDRLFLSNKKLPKKIFAGYGLGDTDIAYHLNQANSVYRFNWNKKAFYDIFNNQKILCNEFLDLLFENNFIVQNSFHLLDDLLIQNDSEIKDELFFKEYLAYSGFNTNTEQQYNLIKGFKKLLLSLENSWLDIISYNDNLIFLRAKDGNYDFVFKGLRDDKFISPFKNFLETKDIPSNINEEYDFNFWLYYGRNRKKENVQYLWKERDEHLSEIEFYKNKPRIDYPFGNKILKDFYKKKDLYSYSISKSRHYHENYELIEIGDKNLCVSKLITISEFFEFYNNDFKYRRSNELEELYSVNFEKPDYPVSVTWYDAIAYCKYLGNKYKKTFRLLTSAEYEIIAPKVDIQEGYDLYYFYNNIKYNSKDESPFVKNYEDMLLRFKEPLIFENKGKLNFVLNSRFKEWSDEFIIYDRVCLLSLNNKFYNYSKQFNSLSASSTNKYKYLKVGFRVCYELEKDEL